MPSILPGDQLKVFVDMDGVITEFDDAVRALGMEPLPMGSEGEEVQKMYALIDKAGEDFWADMEWAKKGKDLWNVILKFTPTPVLLSSPGTFRFAASGKTRWVKSNLPGVSLFLSTSKMEYAEPTSILVDDYEGNINEWKKCGGIGIRYQNPEQVERDILSLMWF